jgi:hypothetical protein
MPLGPVTLWWLLSSTVRPGRCPTPGRSPKSSPLSRSVSV